MNKNQKRKLYESIMLSTSKVIKKKLNEMATRSNKDVLMQIKRLIDNYAESNNVSSIEIKRALGTLSRKWDVSSVNVSNSYNSIHDFFKAITIKRLNGLTGEIDKNDMRYLTRYIKSHLSLSEYNGDPDNDRNHQHQISSADHTDQSRDLLQNTRLLQTADNDKQTYKKQ